MVPTHTSPFHGLWKSTTTAFALIAGAAIFCTALGTAQATPISLTDLVGGDSITFGDKTFTDWEADGDGDWDDIYVEGIIESGDIGLRFTAGDTGLLDDGFGVFLDIDFVVTAGPGFKIIENDIALIDWAFEVDGIIEIDETVFEDPFGTNADIGDKHVDTDGDLEDSLPIAPGQTILGIALAIGVDGLGDPAALYEFDMLFVQMPMSVPEPGALALFGVGLAGLGFLRRRRKA